MTTSSRASGMPGARGFTLIELVVVIAVLGIVLTAAALFFTSSSESADRLVDRDAAESDAVQASLRLDGLVSSAGLCRIPAYGERHPILRAEPECLAFAADVRDQGIFGPEDILTIESTDSGIVVVDASRDTIFRSPPGVSVDFGYYDWTGEPIDSADLAVQAGMDRVRRIEWEVVSTYGEGTYVLHGGCTPPNLML